MSSSLIVAPTFLSSSFLVVPTTSSSPYHRQQFQLHFPHHRQLQQFPLRPTTDQQQPLDTTNNSFKFSNDKQQFLSPFLHQQQPHHSFHVTTTSSNQCFFFLQSTSTSTLSPTLTRTPVGPPSSRGSFLPLALPQWASTVHLIFFSLRAGPVSPQSVSQAHTHTHTLKI